MTSSSPKPREVGELPSGVVLPRVIDATVLEHDEHLEPAVCVLADDRRAGDRSLVVPLQPDHSPPWTRW